MILNILVMVYFRVDYTPRVSGLYSASIKINDMYLWTDHSFGVMIDPTYASAHHSTHNSNAVAVAGAEQLFDVVLRDRFDNRVTAVSAETSVLVHSIGTPCECNHLDKIDEPTVAVKETEIGSIDGHYKISYTPSLAGQYQKSLDVEEDLVYDCQPFRPKGSALRDVKQSQHRSNPPRTIGARSPNLCNGVSSGWISRDLLQKSGFLPTSVCQLSIQSTCRSMSRLVCQRGHL